MKLHEILSQIQETAKTHNLSTPYIVGGVPRDRIRAVPKEISDIDLTSTNGDSVKLAFACSKTLPYNHFQLFDDGHVTIKFGRLQIDFSNHFIIPDIDKELSRLDIKNPTPLIQETYSRDFTINTLLQDLDMNNVYDLTKQAIPDIKVGIIRTPINPDLTIRNDPKRILRALKFSLRFGYSIDPELFRSIKKYRHLLKTISPDYVRDKANQLIQLDKDKALMLMIELGLLNVIPITQLISDALIEKKLLYYAFDTK